MAPRQRRESGEGAIFDDESKDWWGGQLDLGTDAHGRRRRPKVSGAHPRRSPHQTRPAAHRQPSRPSRRPTQPVSGERLTSGEDTAELIKKNAKTVGAALRRSGRDLTDEGELITLGPINLTTGGRPTLEEEIAWIRHNAETRAR